MEQGSDDVILVLTAHNESVYRTVTCKIQLSLEYIQNYLETENTTPI